MVCGVFSAHRFSRLWLRSVLCSAAWHDSTALRSAAIFWRSRRRRSAPQEVSAFEWARAGTLPILDLSGAPVSPRTARVADLAAETSMPDAFVSVKDRAHIQPGAKPSAPLQLPRHVQILECITSHSSGRRDSASVVLLLSGPPPLSFVVRQQSQFCYFEPGDEQSHLRPGR